MVGQDDGVRNLKSKVGNQWSVAFSLSHDAPLIARNARKTRKARIAEKLPMAGISDMYLSCGGNVNVKCMAGCEFMGHDWRRRV